MKLSKKIYDLCNPIWQQCKEHPFIKGLIDGSLPAYKYRFYTMQCDWYLLEFAKTLSLGLLRTPSAELEYFFLAQMNATLGEHEDLYRELSINNEDLKNQRICPNNLAYARYSREIAMSGGLLEVIVSLMACYWSYKILSDYMQEKMNEQTPALYRGLCEKFQDPYYAESVSRMIALMDELSADYSEEELDKLTDVVRKCSIHELDFWQMCWEAKE